MGRYEALLGPDNQFWLYDNDEEVYIDPPVNVLEEIEKIRWAGGEETADSISAAEDRLVEIAEEDPDWLYNEDRCYDVEDWEI